jgi:hypothetical protein
MNKEQKSRLQRLLQHFAQEVPPELEACLICQKSECSQDEWIACDNRIVHAKCLKKIQEGRLIRLHRRISNALG